MAQKRGVLGRIPGESITVDGGPMPTVDPRTMASAGDIKLQQAKKLKGMYDTVNAAQGDMAIRREQLSKVPQMQAPQPDAMRPSQVMYPMDRSAGMQADQMQAQIGVKPDPFAGMSGLKRMLAQGLLGAAEGSIHAQDPGGYSGWRQRQDQIEQQATNSQLEQVRSLRNEQLQREQMYQNEQNAQIGRERQQDIDELNKMNIVSQIKAREAPQFKEFGSATGGYIYGGVDPTTAKFTQQGEIPGAPTAAQMDKNIGNYIDKAGRHVEIFQRPDGTTYEKPFGEVRPPQATSITPGSYAESNVVNRLVQQWDKATKDVSDLYRANTIMQSGLEAARRGDMNAGSQAILITFQKFLDPQSVVRESEYARSAEGLSMANRIQGFVERLQEGGAGVTLPELETFAKLAQQINANLAREGNSLLAKQAERIRRNAQHYGIPEDLVFSGYDFNQNPVVNAGAQAARPRATDGKGNFVEWDGNNWVRAKP